MVALLSSVMNRGEREKTDTRARARICFMRGDAGEEAREREVEHGHKVVIGPGSG